MPRSHRIAYDSRTAGFFASETIHSAIPYGNFSVIINSTDGNIFIQDTFEKSWERRPEKPSGQHRVNRYAELLSEDGNATTIHRFLIEHGTDMKILAVKTGYPYASLRKLEAGLLYYPDFLETFAGRFHMKRSEIDAMKVKVVTDNLIVQYGKYPYELGKACELNLHYYRLNEIGLKPKFFADFIRVLVENKVKQLRRKNHGLTFKKAFEKVGSSLGYSPLQLTRIQNGSLIASFNSLPRFVPLGTNYTTVLRYWFAQQISHEFGGAKNDRKILQAALDEVKKLIPSGKKPALLSKP